MSLFVKFPLCIVDIILSFDGRIVNRNGLYINRLFINDERYKILKSIPLKEFENDSAFVELNIENNKYFFLCSDIFENKNRIYLLLMEFYELCEDDVKNGIRTISSYEYYLL